MVYPVSIESFGAVIKNIAKPTNNGSKPKNTNLLGLLFRKREAKFISPESSFLLFENQLSARFFIAYNQGHQVNSPTLELR